MPRPPEYPEPEIQTDVTWEILWRYADSDQWRGPHYRCYSDEAAEVAVTELREHPSSDKRRYRVDKVTRETIDHG
jgi:hypothetical protein